MSVSHNKHFSISFDMDNLDVLGEAYGIDVSTFGREKIYRTAVARMIKMLDDLNIKATFYIVGACCDNEEACKVIVELSNSGHEIGNHTYDHSNAYGRSQEETVLNIRKGHNVITQATGVVPVGFRAPGYQLTRASIDELCRSGYSYDTSIMPAFMVAAMWFLMYAQNPTSRNLPRISRFMHLFNSSHPFQIKDHDLVELPCPQIFRIFPCYPTFHFTLFSHKWFIHWLNRQIQRMPYIMLEGHALDFLDIEKDSLPSSLAKKHPGMAISWEEKVGYYTEMIKYFNMTHKLILAKNYVESFSSDFPSKKIFC